MTTAIPVVRAEGEGDRRWFYGGGTHTWKVTAQESGGAFFLFEDVMAQGKLTPWHCHPDTDEMVYVLEGEILINVGGDERKVSKGGVSMAPRGVPHAFTVISESARLLAFQTPGTSQSFYWNASEPATSDEPGPVDFDRVRVVADETGATVVLGPPPFERR
ncbi:MAG TPA: cupin domain-containing protein [Acidimicrobiales bacterium]|jgi:quercetin dioxygenase-like cupin family protein|nr:cupin domain-containing protein [Acidimicrobiales bacterium]